MATSTRTLGLIPSPDMTAEIVEKITDILADDLKKQIDANVEWPKK